MKKWLSLLLAALLLLALPALAETEEELMAAWLEAEALYDAGNYAEARAALDALVAKNYGRAANMIGIGYEEGPFSPDGKTDYVMALEWYLKASELGYSTGTNNVGMCYYYGRGLPDSQPDYEAAYAWLTQAREQGSKHPYNTLGDGYRAGHFSANGEPDYATAWENYSKGAEMGNASCMHDIGEGYRHGWWADAPDYQKAIDWYIKADEAGMTCAADHAAGVLLTGGVSADGTMVEKDYARAFEMLERAYANGRRSGYNLGWLGWFYAGNCPEVVQTDYAKAHGFYTEGAEKDDEYCMYMLGLMYLDGRVGENDYATAAEWLGKAAEKGRLDAAEKLAELYTSGRTAEDGTVLFEVDYHKALPALEKAYELGTEYLHVYNFLGWIYAGNGEVVEADYAKALGVYTMGADLGSGYCMEQIGLMYQAGQLGDPDAAKARQWFEAALAVGYEAAQGRLDSLAE